MLKFSSLIIGLTLFYNSHAGKKSFYPKEPVNWVNSFIDFRNAVSKNDIAKVKQFIDFPIMNENNEIWNLAYDNDVKRISKLPSKIQPFTETDFDKYAAKIFTKRFIAAILKINAEELFNKGESKTPEFKDGKITYKMFATYDKESQTISLNLAMQTRDRTEDNGMFNIIYQFDVVQGTDIKFRQVRLAG